MLYLQYLSQFVNTLTYMIYNNPSFWQQIKSNRNKYIGRTMDSSQNLHKHQSMENSQELRESDTMQHNQSHARAISNQKAMPGSATTGHLPPLPLSLRLTSNSPLAFVFLPPDSKFQVGTLIGNACVLAVGGWDEKRQHSVPSPLTSWQLVLNNYISFHCCIILVI